MNEKYNNIKEIKHLYLMNDNDIEKAAECNADAYIGYKLYDYFFKDKCRFGTVLTISSLIRALKSPTLLGVLASIIYLINYIALIFYTVKNYNKKEDIYFQGVIYAYASVLGIQILQIGEII